MSISMCYIYISVFFIYVYSMYVHFNVCVEFDVHEGMHYSSLLFGVVDIVTELAREGVLSDLRYADDLVLMSETIDGLRDEFMELMDVVESQGLKANLGKTKVMVSGGITKDGLSISKVDQSEVCGVRVVVNSVLCVRYGKWIHTGCVGVNRVSSTC